MTSSADTLTKITNFTQDKYGLDELELVGHTKRTKSNAQNIFNNNILATCGGDGIIFIWDKRISNKRFCTSQCLYYKSNKIHIHPIGAFRNLYKDLVLRKKYTQNIGILNWEVHNTFTEVDFYDNNLNYKQKNRLSSKFNSNENSLFPSIYFFSTTSTNKRKQDLNKNKIKENNISNINENQTILDDYLKKMKNNFETKMTIDKDLNHENMEIENNINYPSSNNTSDIFSTNYEYSNDEYNSEMEIYYREKIKESRNKQGIKGLTSLNINREKGSILINSISGNQYIYDSLFLDEKEPIELKLNTSSLYVKSVLSTSGRYVLSGSKGPEMIIWDLYRKNKEGNFKKYEFNNVHKRDVNAVGWGRNYNNFIASGCDAGLVVIWDVNNI